MSNSDADAFNIALVTQLAKVTLYSYKNMGLSAEDVVSLTLSDMQEFWQRAGLSEQAAKDAVEGLDEHLLGILNSASSSN